MKLVLPEGIAPSSWSYQLRALLLSYRSMKMNAQPSPPDQDDWVGPRCNAEGPLPFEQCLLFPQHFRGAECGLGTAIVLAHWKDEGFQHRSLYREQKW